MKKENSLTNLTGYSSLLELPQQNNIYWMTYTTEVNFLTVLETGSLRLRCPQGCCLVRVLSWLADSDLLSVLSHSREKERERVRERQRQLALVSFPLLIRAATLSNLGSTNMASFSCLLKSTISKYNHNWVRISTYEFRWQGDTI
jgi:hypothetical protein